MAMGRQESRMGGRANSSSLLEILQYRAARP